MKLIDDTINISSKDLKIFLELLSAFADSRKSPYLVDSAQTMLAYLFNDDEAEQLKSDFQVWSEGQIKFDNPQKQ